MRGKSRKPVIVVGWPRANTRHYVPKETRGDVVNIDLGFLSASELILDTETLLIG
jgi:hypothetical protein